MEERLRTMLGDSSRTDRETARLARLMRLIGELAPPPDPASHFKSYDELKRRFLAAADGDDGELIEERFLELYAHLHMHEAPYTPEERRRVDASGGYWCHSGGLAPILKAGDWLGPGSVSADLGAGNGLQGLLLQLLHPHARTIQLEISSRMIDIGRGLQSWLGIPRERVDWRLGDLLEVPLEDVDLLYLYRPVRPDGPGRRFYESLAGRLERAPGQVVIFSIADCLGDFLSDRFERFYGDGHLTCFRKLREFQGSGCAQRIPRSV
jgi:hypothetical protein